MRKLVTKILLFTALIVVACWMCSCSDTFQDEQGTVFRVEKTCIVNSYNVVWDPVLEQTVLKLDCDKYKVDTIKN